MKKYNFALIGLSVLVFALTGVSHAWQGRMGGMGDPYGLISDESDFLIHPAKIAAGEGVRFYGNYRFTYRDIMDWDYNVNGFDLTTGVLIRYYNYDTSGNEQRHEGLLGVTFPLGSGRQGLFFEYTGTRGLYDGDEHYWEGAGELYSPYNLQRNLDDFVLKLLYGLPVGGGFSLGGALQLSYRQEENETWQQQGNTGVLNNISNGVTAALNLFPFMIPYDSEYWEVLLKNSIEGSIGPVGTAFTLRGGYLFGGDNTLEYEFQDPLGTPFAGFDLDGTVEGWRVGGDLWVRYPLSREVSLPFLVRIDYQEKGRDGDCITDFGVFSGVLSYEHKEKNFEVEAGGGVDARLGERSRIAAGLYYSYRDTKDDYRFRTPSLFLDLLNNSDYPASTEHRAILRLAEEEKLSSTFAALRYGLEFFYGWVQEDFNATALSWGAGTEEVSLDGYRWGIGLSLGGTLRFQRLNLEPFVNAGYQELNLEGKGKTVVPGPDYNSEMEQTMREWFVGGGLSFTWGSQRQEADQVSVEAAEPGAGEEYASVRRCPQCGRTFEADYVFCPYDKTELEVVRVKK